MDINANFTLLGTRQIANVFLPLGHSSQHLFALTFQFSGLDVTAVRKAYVRENFGDSVLSSAWMRIYPRPNETHLLSIPFRFPRVIEIKGAWNAFDYTVSLYEYAPAYGQT